MDTDELRAAFAEAKAQSLKLLEPKSGTVSVSRRAPNDGGILLDSSHEVPKKAQPSPTVADFEAIIDEKIDRHTEIWREVIGRVIAQERKRHRDEVGKLRSDHDLRICGLSQSVEMLERGNGDRGEVIDLPALPMVRSRRHA
jgi:hypothetical protein